MNEEELIKYERLASLNNEDAIYLLARHYQDKSNFVKAFSYLTRIILDLENPLISPCKCTGSIKYLHLKFELSLHH